mmetsp:Transcript_55170/g.118528  ORF Transcript_55170/g.118528 Transcript_55170/m.118528 type:complete len:232 (+) Transcript_55170:973-1668(+)
MCELLLEVHRRALILLSAGGIEGPRRLRFLLRIQGSTPCRRLGAIPRGDLSLLGLSQRRSCSRHGLSLGSQFLLRRLRGHGRSQRLAMPGTRRRHLEMKSLDVGLRGYEEGLRLLPLLELVAAHLGGDAKTSAFRLRPRTCLRHGRCLASELLQPLRQHPGLRADAVPLHRSSYRRRLLHRDAPEEDRGAGHGVRPQAHPGAPRGSARRPMAPGAARVEREGGAGPTSPVP